MMGYRWGFEEDVNVVHFWDFPGWEKLDIELRDKYLIERISEIILSADVLVGHYSIKFDFAFLQTRCLIHGLPPLPQIPHLDTWRIAKYQLALRSNAMKAISSALRLPERKSSCPPHIWRRAQAHDMDALKQISDYCVQDIKTQYAMTQKLIPLARNLPNCNLLTGSPVYQCPACGSREIRRAGDHHTKINTYPRYRCVGCGHWSRGRSTDTKTGVERHMY
jgi:DNA polymerase elongation subunit (family B)